MDKIWYRNPSKAGMKKTMNDQAEPTKSNTKKKLYKNFVWYNSKIRDLCK